MPYQNTNQQLQAALMQQMQQPTSHKYGGVGKAALAAAMAIRGKREQEAAKNQRIAQATALKTYFSGGGGTDAQGNELPGTARGLPDIGSMDPAVLADLMSTAPGQALIAQQFGQGSQRTNTMTPEQLQAYGYEPGTVAQIGPHGKHSVTQRPYNLERELAGLSVDERKARLEERANNVKLDRAKTEGIFTAYQSMMGGIASSLTDSVTGPIFGYLPNWSESRQTAAQIRKQMLPVLKQFFRGPGEGVFTDKDQDALMATLPTEYDSPPVRDIKIKYLDNLVRAKLGMPLQDSGAVQPGAPQDVDGQINALERELGL